MAQTAKKSATPYVVKAACIVAKINSETGEGYLYRGMVLPDGVPDEEIERLADMGLIESKAKADKTAAKKAAARKATTPKDESVDETQRPPAET